MATLLFIYRITRNSVSEIVICWSLVFNFQHKTANTITNIFAGSIMQWNLNAIKERGFVSIVFKRFIDSVFCESLSSKTKWNQGWVLLLFLFWMCSMQRKYIVFFVWCCLNLLVIVWCPDMFIRAIDLSHFDNITTALFLLK